MCLGLEAQSCLHHGPRAEFLACPLPQMPWGALPCCLPPPGGTSHSGSGRPHSALALHPGVVWEQTWGRPRAGPTASWGARQQQGQVPIPQPPSLGHQVAKGCFHLYSCAGMTGETLGALIKQGRPSPDRPTIYLFWLHLCGVANTG